MATLAANRNSLDNICIFVYLLYYYSMTLENYSGNAPMKIRPNMIDIKDYDGSRELLKEITDTDPDTIISFRTLTAKVLGVSAAIGNILLVNGEARLDITPHIHDSTRIPSSYVLQRRLVDDTNGSKSWLEVFQTNSGGARIIELKKDEGRARLTTVYIPSDETIHDVRRLDPLSLHQHPFNHMELQSYGQDAPKNYFEDLRRLTSHLLAATD